MAFDRLVKAGLFLFIPFILSSSPLAIIPFMLIFFGMILLFISIPEELNKKYRETNEQDQDYDSEKTHKESHMGGFLMIGPIPIIFGNDKRLIYISILAAIILIAIYLLIIFHLLEP